jgi:hypothetical protein
MFDPVDMQATCLEIDRLPTQRHRFGHPHSMPVHAEHERRIMVRMAAHLSGRSKDLLDFVWGQIFPRPPFGICQLLGGCLDRK